MADKLMGSKDSKRTLPPYLQAHLKTAQATARPKFLKELAKPTQKKNCLKKTPMPH
jgi:hypothetical protein